MRLRIDPSSAEPVSSQLVRLLRSAIERGSLEPGSRVPPVRSLALELDLAPNTVAKAYRSLVGAGLLEGRGRHGTYVTERLPTSVSEDEARLAEAAGAFARRARQLGFGPGDARRALDRAFRTR